MPFLQEGLEFWEGRRAAAEGAEADVEPGRVGDGAAVRTDPAAKRDAR